MKKIHTCRLNDRRACFTGLVRNLELTRCRPRSYDICPRLYTPLIRVSCVPVQGASITVFRAQSCICFLVTWIIKPSICVTRGKTCAETFQNLNSERRRTSDGSFKKVERKLHSSVVEKL